MNVKDTIMKLIDEETYVSAHITEESNLYTDLGFDSLSFITLLAKIEEACTISFNIDEMESCIQVGRLISISKSKAGEAADND